MRTDHIAYAHIYIEKVKIIKNNKVDKHQIIIIVIENI